MPPVDPLPLLVPTPQQLRRGVGAWSPAPPGSAPIGLATPAGVDGERLRKRLDAGLAGWTTAPGTDIVLRLDAAADLGGEGYRLRVAPDGLVLTANAPAGLSHGVSTLLQLLKSPTTAGALRVPCLEIEDTPTLAVRGVMLDVSRGRVPRMDQLLERLDVLAGWKLNQLQLYFEHAFAYAGHEEVWRDVDPFTPDEIRTLDAACRERFIELVPNQQSFGHMHRWLRLERYRGLSEVPAGVEHPFHLEPEPFSLCPSDPAGLALLAELYDQLLPCFDSGSFNVGLDETFDVGRGRSRAAVAERGLPAVYVQHVRDVHALVRARGKRMQMWADVLLSHPGSEQQVPEDVVPILWGYEGDHDFDSGCERLARSGREFLVAPGTSAWQSLGGRIENLLANVPRAVEAARAHGAQGILTTDWGDRGHLQPPCTALPGFALAAARAWNAGAACGPVELATALDRDAWQQPGLGLGAALLDLGRTATATGATVENASPLFYMLVGLSEPFPPERVSGLTEAGLGAAGEHLSRIGAALQSVAARTPAGRLALDEAEFAARALALAVDLGRERMGITHHGNSEKALRERLEGLREDLAALWNRSSRGAGLRAAQAWLGSATVWLS